jgi:SAM-dependent methyltransferase
VAQASKLARAEGFDHLRYKVADLNTIKLPKCTYDVVFGISSIHHVANLEHLFLQVALSLKPGGYFFLNEYIGPNQLQWTDEQLAVVNELLAPLPLEFRRCISDPRIIKGTVKPSTIEEINAVDPSEAIRSADILKLLPQYFDILEIRGYGGTLLQPLLNDIAGHFSEDDPRSMGYLQSFFDLEDQVIASGKVQHDCAIIVARRKPTRVEKLLGSKAAYVVSKARAMLSGLAA